MRSRCAAVAAAARWFWLRGFTRCALAAASFACVCWPPRPLLICMIATIGDSLIIMARRWVAQAGGLRAVARRRRRQRRRLRFARRLRRSHTTAHHDVCSPRSMPMAGASRLMVAKFSRLTNEPCVKGLGEKGGLAVVLRCISTRAVDGGQKNGQCHRVIRRRRRRRRQVALASKGLTITRAKGLALVQA